MIASPLSFAARIIAWQREHGRHDLPWQRTRDAYRIWLSEVMLQQTQVATVLPYYLRFVDAFPTVATLAAAPLERVLTLWSGLGYYRRAHHLHAAAKTVVARHGGRFPTDSAALETLPGVGRSTAAAIAAFASDEQGAILDGNVKRVIARHRGIDGWPGDARVQATLWRAADALVAHASIDIAAYTQGMMDVGATLCTRTPRCDACPVADDCIARLEARIDALPAPRPRKELPRRSVTVLLLQRGDDILLEQRPPVGVWSGLWSLPELDCAADPRRYVCTRFNTVANDVRLLSPMKHAFTHFVLTMHPVAMTIPDVRSVFEEPQVGWFTRDAAIAAALPSPIRRLLRAYT